MKFNRTENKYRLFIFLLLILNFSFSQVAVTRGPYLQQSTENSIIIHWRTDSLCDSKVWYGNSLSTIISNITISTKTQEHIVKITGLNSNSKYFYMIGNSSAQFFSSDPNLYFYTHPPAGTADHFRFWVIGDAGMGDNNQRVVRDGFFYKNNNKKLDGWIWLGDNAYLYGLDSEYQANIFSNNTYENIVKNLVAWAAPGNHDYAQNANAPSPDYLSIFDFPTNGEAGGLASGTEKYFSWNYGNVHFIQLDSYGSDRSDTGVVATWLRADLAQNNSTWTIAYWHHPPYTKGSHDSDNPDGANPELPQIRNGFVPILEQYGVDLILNGHSHAYERSKFMDEHYGYSSSLNDSMFVDSTSGCYPASCAYHKDTINGKGHKGTVYSVVGVSGKTGSVAGTWPHPIMQSAIQQTLGSMLLEVYENKLHASFINAFGQTLDSFTIVKNMKVHKIIYACKDSALTIYPTWHEPANWPSAFYGDSIVIFPSADTMVIANDAVNCLTDTFDVKVIPDSICIQTIGVEKQKDAIYFSVFPSPVNSGNNFTIQLKGKEIFKSAEIFIHDISGKMVMRKKLNTGGNNFIETFPVMGIDPGIYFVSLLYNGKKSVRKLIVAE